MLGCPFNGWILYLFKHIILALRLWLDLVKMHQHLLCLAAAWQCCHCLALLVQSSADKRWCDHGVAGAGPAVGFPVCEDHARVVLSLQVQYLAVWIGPSLGWSCWGGMYTPLGAVTLGWHLQHELSICRVLLPGTVQLWTAGSLPQPGCHPGKCL